MCELLGVSSNRETNIQFSNQAMEAHSHFHSSGWGIAFYPRTRENEFFKNLRRQCSVFKETSPMHQSDLLRLLNEGQVVRSKIILSHIRLATGSVAHENTHPFVRELFGQEWALSHNGASGIKDFFWPYVAGTDEKIRFTPLGSTGSEKLLCIILNELARKVPVTFRHGKKMLLSSIEVNYDFETAQRVIYEICQKIGNFGADANLIMSNGEYLFAYYSGFGKLHYLLRDQQEMAGKDIALRDTMYGRLGLEKEPGEKAAVVATEILTQGEEWKRFDKGEMLVFKDGVLEYRNGKKVNAS